VASIGCLAHLSDDSGGLEEQAGSVAVKSCSFPGDGEVLAGEPVGDAVDGLQKMAGTLSRINVCDRSYAIASIV